MLSRMRVALKFMTYGIVIGVLFAPRSGSETRHEVMSKIGSMTGGLFGGSRQSY